MASNVLRILSLLVMVVAFGGCGQGSTPVQVPTTSPKDALKSNLRSAAETGQLGSEMIALQDNIEKLKQTDPALADQLSQDLEKMQAASDPAAVKAIAQEMLNKLEGGTPPAAPPAES